MVKTADVMKRLFVLIVLVVVALSAALWVYFLPYNTARHIKDFN
jgi:hypothetical protein